MIENMPAGSEPSWIRQDVWMYWLTRLPGSKPYAALGDTNTQMSIDPTLSAAVA